MAAYVMANIMVQDRERYKTYADLVPATIAQYGGRYLARGGRAETLEGDTDAGRLVLLEFESYDKARQWWTSTAYEAAKPHRQQSAMSSIMLVEGIA